MSEQADSAPVDARVADAAPVGANCDASDIADADLKACYTEALCQSAKDCEGFFLPDDDCGLIYDYYRALGINIEPLIDQFAAQLAAGASDLDGEAFATCLAGVALCDSNPPECNQIFIGLKAANEPCINDTECGRGGDCSGGSSNNCVQGTCVLPGTLGASCDNGEPCEYGLVCSRNQATNQRRCTSGDLNQTCESDNECDDPLYCDESGTRTCTMRRPEGQVCNDDRDCQEPLECLAGSCQRPDADGDPCDSNCIGPFFCEPGGGGGQLGSCRPLPTLNGDCSVSNSCRGANLYCDGASCLEFAAIGTTCDNDSVKCDLGLACDLTTMQCADPAADGTSCTQNQECDSFFCSGAPLECTVRDLCY